MSDREFQLESLSPILEIGLWQPISTEVKLLSEPDVAKQGGNEPPDTTITLSVNFKYQHNNTINIK